MMKIAKRTLAVLLTLFMFLSVVPVGGMNASASDEAGETHYTVLLLDVSKSMLGMPLEKEKEAAIKFCEVLLSTNPNNKIAIISFNTSAKTICKFSNDYEILKTVINKLSASGGTNINQALSNSNTLLSSVDSNPVEKSIVLCSDGIPEHGSTANSGPYTEADSPVYKYANKVYSTATTLKNKYNIYSLGFFHSLSGDNLAFGQRLMNDIQNAGYYEVINPENLNTFFEKLANDVFMKTYTMRNDEVSITCDYKYTDSFFDQSSYKYNHNLSIASCCLASVVMVSDNRDYNGYIQQKPPQAAIKMFSDLGFGDENDIYFSPSYKIEPEQNSIACAIANKNLSEKDISIVAVSIRGGGYKGEWAGNFNVGKSGIDHAGFRIAANKVLDELSSYIIEKADSLCSNIKFWITGYSRSAAVANLVAKSLDDSCSTKVIGSSKMVSTSTMIYQTDDIFAYCFEPPKNTTEKNSRDQKYNHIFNIVNRIDPVPRVAPSQWGFTRYGKDCYLPSKETTGKLYSTLMKSLKNNYDEIDNHVDKQGNPVQYTENFRYYKVGLLGDLKEISQGVFLDNLIRLISKKVVKSREKYAYEFQNSVMSFLYKINSSGVKYDEGVSINELLMDYISEHFSFEFLEDIITAPVKKQSYSTKAIWVSILEGFCKLYKINVTYSEISDAAALLNKAIIPMLTNLDLLSTAIVNGAELIIPHKTETTLAWLVTLNGNYENASAALSKTLSGESSYRVATINCPVNISVYDVDGELRGSIVKNEVQDVGENGLSVYINDDGEKCFVLPNCEEFHFKIEAYDKGEMSMTFSDFDFELEEKTISENYYGIPLQEGTMITAFLDQKSEVGIVADVEVFDNNNVVIEASEEINYSETEAYKVSVESNNEECIVLGGGEYYKGEFSQVTAIPTENLEFMGWYSGDSLISQDEVYRFMVSSDTNLTAKFSHIHADNGNDGYCDTCGEMMIGDEHCLQCGKIHNGGFSDKLVGFFHRIIYRITHLFVRKRHKHTYDEGVITTRPTCTEPGVKSYTCTTCEAGTEGHIKTEAISALCHTEPDSNGKCIRCGAQIEQSNPQRDPNACKWCGKTHEGFFQKIIGFFHNILAAVLGAKF